MRRNVILFALIVVLVFGLLGTVYSSSNFPRKPITLIVQWQAGGAAHLLAQEMGAKLGELLGTRVIVQCMPGGSGATATAFVKNSAPDGYTLLQAWIAPMVQVPLHEDNVPYDVFNDFEYLAHATVDYVIAYSRADAPWDTMAEFVDYVKKNPQREYSFGGGGALSLHSLYGDTLFRNAGLNVKGIYYAGSGHAHPDLISGMLDVVFDNAPALKTHEGRIKPIGIFAEERLPNLPDIPTIKEQGFDAPTVPSWSGIIAPKGLPADVREILVEAFREILTNEEIKQEIYNKLNYNIVYLGPDDFEEMVRISTEQMREPIARIKAN